MRALVLLCLFTLPVHTTGQAIGQTLEQRLLTESPAEIAADARRSGDARRGAILFHRVHVGCVKCHAVDGSENSLGPDLTELATQPTTTDEFIVTSVLRPSDVIRKGFETVTVVTSGGKTHTGLLVERSEATVVLRNAERSGERLTFRTADIDEVVPGKLSIMPAGIAGQLASRQQFLDLVKYLLELRDGGLQAAVRLQPPPGSVTLTLPEYEARVDHAGVLRDLDDAAFQRGAEIYDRLCINCHGDRERPGSLPTALRFSEGSFKNGSDPYSMYRTLTHGFGFMVPQMWMVPRQKYDVIHFIRESYLRNHNPAQYAAITDAYLMTLPPGDMFGPEAREYAPWADMNYGPSMINTFEVGEDGHNFAYKGIATRLDAGPGGIAKGNRWAIFDHDTLRFAAAWTRDPESTAPGFVNWEGIHFDGRHSRHPRIVGDLQFENATGPGWSRPGTIHFADDARVIGRDGRRYGPLPLEWAKFRGLYAAGDDTVVSYSVGKSDVLELAGTLDATVDDDALPVFTRTLKIGPVNEMQMMSVATLADDAAQFESLSPTVAVLRPKPAAAPHASRASSETQQGSLFRFNGSTHLEISSGAKFDMSNRDFTIMARVRTENGGTIFCQTKNEGPWLPNGKTLFIREGRLCYDIGWVGVVESRQRVDDGEWHDVALAWTHEDGAAALFIDGVISGGGTLKPEKSLENAVAKIGFTAEDFPEPTQFTGDIAFVEFHQRAMSAASIRAAFRGDDSDRAASARWELGKVRVDSIAGDTTGNGHDAVIRTDRHEEAAPPAVLAGIVGPGSAGCELRAIGNRSCVLFAKHAQSRDVVVWTMKIPPDVDAAALNVTAESIADRVQIRDLADVIRQPARPRWPEILTTTAVLGEDDGPFAVDTLTSPADNPWFARLRFGGHDFFADGDRVAVCSWDGDVWLVRGLKALDSVPGERRDVIPQAASVETRNEPAGQSDPGQTSGTRQPGQLTWQRIASGLFQPLGVKVVAGEVYVTCRDQLVILRDYNQDGETDFYECFNNDHQVTEHFHEFAMGLQRDEIGNFYYAKSARHALTALVPHHGTLLRIPSDGSRTDILANGFRAANGVCLNPDGSFIVTDQEGHWNPKNRINWVRAGGFYGNMFGYHDVTDDADDAMEQPLCWITNAFDRSPAELLWVDSEKWGALNGSLLNLSYGYGKVYVVPHEDVGGQMQGGMCELPIPQFPTGIMRGRFHPDDGQLYLCGLFAWASNQQAREGGFYRLRATGRESYLPTTVKASGTQIAIGLTDPVDRAAASDIQNFQVRVWSLKRTANYGSDHYDEHSLEVTAAELSPDGRTLTLTIPKLEPTWCMEIRCQLKTTDGRPFERVIHSTIHRLAD